MFKFVKRRFEVVSKNCASPSAVAPSLIFCRPEPYFFVTPSASEGWRANARQDKK
jgi:hypothetical protein